MSKEITENTQLIQSYCVTDDGWGSRARPQRSESFRSEKQIEIIINGG